jgi:hypothetical protein
LAYPFGAPIPWLTFLDRLVTKHGCEIRASEMRYRSPDGKIEQFRYLRRVVDGKVKVSGIPEQEPTSDALVTVIRSICAKLLVHPNNFGILSELGGPDDDDD